MIFGELAEFEVPERTVSSCLISGILRNLDDAFSVYLGCYVGDDVAAMTEPALPYLVSRLVATLSSPVGYLGDVLLAVEVSGLAMVSLEACRGVVLLGYVVVALRDAGVLEGVVVAPLEAIFYSFEGYFYILNYLLQK